MNLRRRLQKLEQASWMKAIRSLSLGISTTPDMAYGDLYPIARELADDPAQIMVRSGLQPDAWQLDLLRSQALEVQVLAARQVGKTSVVAAIVLKEILSAPRRLAVICGPSERQSQEMLGTVVSYWESLDRPIRPARRGNYRKELRLVNGSRAVAVPENERTIRGYPGVTLVVLDEAARIEDDLYKSVRPMLAVTKGRMIACSTAHGKIGWFFNAWEEEPSLDVDGHGWYKVSVTADKCPRYTSEYLEQERCRIGERWYAQEFKNEFREQADNVFRRNDILAAMQTQGRAPLVGANVFE